MVALSQKRMSVLAFGPEPFELCVLVDGQQAEPTVETE